MSHTVATVKLWGSAIGAVSYDTSNQLCVFRYHDNFALANVEPSPLKMPVVPRNYQFAELDASTFSGLPGMLADVLPDRFGNAVIDAWLATQGRTANSLNPVERLCYIGTRGMGALEFEPTLTPQAERQELLQIESLVDLANSILSSRAALNIDTSKPHIAQSIKDILRVGSSAGGARAKALIAFNPQTNECYSGQSNLHQGFEHWLLKFDGVTDNRDREASDPLGYGLIEYAYSKMAVAAGVQMSECRLLQEKNRHHFLTKRFDRTTDGKKLHMQSLCAIQHLDFRMARAHSYEQALLTMRQLHMKKSELLQQLRRMIFNVVARNQDDHTKNIAYLMDKQGRWTLSPAFDVTWSFNPDGEWTSRHQMSIQSKVDDFVVNDFIECAKVVGVGRKAVEQITDEVIGAVTAWGDYAAAAEVPTTTAEKIAQTHRLDILD
ncbi:MAG: type II toxin-antitoxin system HipA family toxin [Planctomycetes bacterium]|nr:type II toxin-antitoxin system HipA family toxin [Planctomycetota bacterium]